MPEFFGSSIQSYVETFLQSFENNSQNVQLPTLKLHYGTIFQPAWQECFYTTLYLFQKKTSLPTSMMSRRGRGRLQR